MKWNKESVNIAASRSRDERDFVTSSVCVCFFLLLQEKHALHTYRRNVRRFLNKISKNEKKKQRKPSNGIEHVNCM